MWYGTSMRVCARVFWLHFRQFNLYYTELYYWVHFRVFRVCSVIIPAPFLSLLFSPMYSVFWFRSNFSLILVAHSVECVCVCARVACVRHHLFSYHGNKQWYQTLSLHRVTYPLHYTHCTHTLKQTWVWKVVIHAIVISSIFRAYLNCSPNYFLIVLLSSNDCSFC